MFNSWKERFSAYMAINSLGRSEHRTFFWCAMWILVPSLGRLCPTVDNLPAGSMYVLENSPWRLGTFSLLSMQLYSLSLLWIEFETSSLQAMQLGKFSLLDTRLQALSLMPMQVEALSLLALQLGTLSLQDIRLRTFLPAGLCPCCLCSMEHYPCWQWKLGHCPYWLCNLRHYPCWQWNFGHCPCLLYNWYIIPAGNATWDIAPAGCATWDIIPAGNATLDIVLLAVQLGTLSSLLCNLGHIPAGNSIWDIVPACCVTGTLPLLAMQLGTLSLLAV
jgi:hypothetical protein